MANNIVLPAGYVSNIATVVNPALETMGQKVKAAFYDASSIQVSYKHDPKLMDVLTNIDAEVEVYLYEKIRKAFPEIGFQLEEHPELNDLSKDIICSIDPIDGTRNFSRQLPNFVCQVGFSFQGKPISGHIIDPLSGRFYYGSIEQATSLNGKQVSISQVSDIDAACISVQVTSKRAYWNEEQSLIAQIYGSVLCNVGKLRNFGTTGWHLVNIAAGNLDGGVWLTVEHPHDVVPGIAVLEAAGGKVERFQIPGLTGERMVAGNAELVSNLKRLILDIS